MTLPWAAATGCTLPAQQGFFCANPGLPFPGDCCCDDLAHPQPPFLLLQPQLLPHLQPEPQPALELPLLRGAGFCGLLPVLQHDGWPLLVLLVAVVVLLVLCCCSGTSGIPSWMNTSCCTAGLPTVRVPVLSNTTTCVLQEDSRKCQSSRESCSVNVTNVYHKTEDIWVRLKQHNKLCAGSAVQGGTPVSNSTPTYAPVQVLCCL